MQESLSSESLMPVLRQMPMLLRNRILARRNADETYSCALRYNMTQHFFDALAYNHGIGKNNVLNIYGEGGMNKSSSGLYWCCTQDPTFKDDGFDRVSWDVEQALEMQKFITKGKAFMVDERPTDTGIGSGKRASDFHMIIETARKPRNDIVVVGIREELADLAHWFLEAMFVYDDIAHFALKDYNGYFVGYVKLPQVCTIAGNAFWEKYDARKDEFNERIREQRIDESRFDEKALEVLTLPLAGKFVCSGKLSRNDANQLVDMKFPQLKQNNVSRAIGDKLAFWAKAGMLREKMEEAKCLPQKKKQK